MNATFNLKRFFLLEQYQQRLKLLHRTYTGFLPQPLPVVVPLHRPLPVGDKYHQTDLYSIPVDARFRF